MNKNYILKLISRATFSVFAFGGSALFAQTTYTFTSAGATGSVGPTQGQVNTAYASTNLNGSVVVNPQGIQNFTVPNTGIYKIEGRGAQGGNVGGLGATMIGNFTLTGGSVLNIIVGQVGTGTTSYQGAGGGGSFVWLNGPNTLYLAAAGGGGYSANGGGFGGAGSSTTLTTNGGGAGCGAGGVGGNGGAGGGGVNGSPGFPATGGGGAGWNSNGANGTIASAAFGGNSPLNGGVGGAGVTTWSNAGGFGGGGGAGGNSGASGGGGGYNGGGGGNIWSGSAWGSGGGGGSFNAGTAQSNTSGNNSGNGLVMITQLYGVSISQTSSISCNSGSNAALSSTVSGGQAPYTYTWLPSGGNASTATGLSAGVYTLIVVDNNSVTTTSTYSVTQPAVVTASVTNFINETCYGNANGSSTVSVNGGTAPYSYTWSPVGGTTNIATGLSAGVYTCVVKDNNNCPTAAVSVTITSPAAIGGTATTLSVCNGNTIALGGVGATSYTWSGNITNGASFTPTASASYTVVGSNSVTGCTGTAVLSVTLNTTPTITISNPTICVGQTTTLNPSGASTYSYSSGSPVVNPSSTTVFTVSGSSSAGCLATPVTVTVVVSPCTGVNNVTADQLKITVYPNPSNGVFIVDAMDLYINSIDVIDLNGKLILTKTINDTKATLDIQNFANGTYFIKINSTNGIQNLKINKQ